MTPEKIDYVAILNDMKVKRSVLDTSIAALEAALASGTLGQGVEGLASGASGGTVPNGQAVPMDLPKGAFLGRNMTDAVVLYLTAVRQRKTVKEIAAALLEGGIVSTSENFVGVVQAKMQQLQARGQVLKFADGWGLAEWYPAGFRTSAEKSAKPKKKAKRKAKSKANPKTEVKLSPDPAGPVEMPKPQNPGAQAVIEEYFATHPNEEFSTAQLATLLGLKVGSANLICAKLARNGKLEKTGPGNYRAIAPRAA